MGIQQWLEQFITGLAFWSSCLIGAGWLFKEAMGRALDKRIELYKGEQQRQTERLKTEWQRQSQSEIEKLKAELLSQGQNQLEQLRAELNARNESIRHEMQKQYLRAQLATTKTHEVYSKLIKFVRRSEGAVVGLMGLRRTVDHKTLSLEQLEEILKKARAGGDKEAEIIAELKANKNEGIKLIEEVLRYRELNDAESKYRQAVNHLVLNGIFVTKRVRELADGVLKEIWNAWTNVHMNMEFPGSGPWIEQYRAALTSADRKIVELEEAMQADLLPEIVGTLLTVAAETKSKQPQASLAESLNKGLE